MKKRILSMLVIFAMLFACVGVTAAPGSKMDGAPAGVVLFTNDVHCGINDGWGYAGVAACKKLLQDAGIDTVLVDAGDHVQGGPIGTLSHGQYIIDIMNYIGYDLAVPGNHEVDYTVPQLFNLVESADFPYISSNFMHRENGEYTTRVFDAYEIIEAGGYKVAFVGICTPETITKSTPIYFQNEDGEYIYGFCQDQTGEGLVAAAQAAVDEAKAEGADYVFVVGHCGIEETSYPWRSTDIIPRLSGIDVFIDGHSHTVVNDVVTNADGEDVLLVQTGTKLANIGMIEIHEDGHLVADMLEAPEDALEYGDPDTQAFIDGIEAQYQELLNEVVAYTEYDLCVNDPETGDRMVRSRETNLGDLCADAYRSLLGADVAFVNGGGVRATIAAGEITFGDIINVHPFGNEACLVEVTGQQILDALEMGARNVPGENGGFMQVSGLTYEVNTSIEPNVIVNEDKMWVSSAGGEYRVQNVMVLDRETGEYLPLDVTGTYTLASHNYMLLNQGDGMAMFGKQNVNVIMENVMIDNAVLINYIQSMPAKTVTLEDGAEVEYEHVVEGYENPYGEGRITILTGDEPAEPTDEPAPTDIPDQPAPPATGAVSLIGIGIAAVAVGVGIVIFRRRRDD